ncbi:MAG TPA: YfiR family protein [Thermoanaerobaculia bacterium]|nr:YfiR family protein [Thermoanaerobaculia bacterium]
MALLGGTRRRFAVFLLLAGLPAASIAQGAGTSEHAVKAAFLYNFAKFVEWPEGTFRSPGEPLAFCVLAEGSFGNELERTVAGKTVAGRPVTVRRLSQLAGLDKCHILFVGASESPRFDQILAAVGERPVLTVGEEEGFTRAGGIISFVVRSSRVRFLIDRETAGRAGLRLSSRLLELAEEGP